MATDKEIGEYKIQFSRQVETLFAKFDGVIARAIGFDGSIIETIRSRRTHTKESHLGKIDEKGIDRKLKPFISQGRFNLTGNINDKDRLHYEIDCQLGFIPIIQLPTKDGGKVEFKVYGGPEANEFHHVALTRYYHSPDGDFLRARTLQVFDGLYSGGHHHLIMNTRFASQGEVSMAYDLIGSNTKPGDVKISDGSMVYTSDKKFYGPISGKSVRWMDHSMPENTIWSEANNSLKIEMKGDWFDFPIRTNIGEEIVNITLGIVEIQKYPEIPVLRNGRNKLLTSGNL